MHSNLKEINMVHLKMLLNWWWKKLILRPLFWLIFISCPLALIPWFFWRVIFNLNVTYLMSWRWTYIAFFALSVLLSLLKLWFKWQTTRILADTWHTTPEAVFDALINLKVFKGESFEDMKQKKGQTFLDAYRTAIHEKRGGRKII